MKILVVHNRYRIRAGEDAVFDKEVNLLQQYRHEVETWVMDNQDIDSRGFLNQLHLGINTIWSWKSYREMKRRIRDFKPDIVHVHNILPLLSPSIFYACQSQKIPVVQTLHNYRLGCPVATLFREGQICEKCLTQSLWLGIYHGCYRNSRLQTAIIAAMLQIHRWLGTWQNRVDGYIAVSQFLKEKIIEVGISSEKIYVKPNFIALISSPPENIEFGSYYLYVGRLVEEKGILWLLETYKEINPRYPLMIVGEGDLVELVQDYDVNNSMIHYVGVQSKEDVLAWMRGAIALIFPSLWYECCPLTIIEAYSQNLPVIATNLGAMTELIKPRQTGLFFKKFDTESLREQLIYIESNLERWLNTKKDIKSFVDNLFFRELNYQLLIDIYQKIINHNTNQRSP
jgi:glycosyltransferase involved in cell wall biosynthesis